MYHKEGTGVKAKLHALNKQQRVPAPKASKPNEVAECKKTQVQSGGAACSRTTGSSEGEAEAYQQLSTATASSLWFHTMPSLKSHHEDKSSS